MYTAEIKLFLQIAGVCSDDLGSAFKFFIKLLLTDKCVTGQSF